MNSLTERELEVCMLLGDGRHIKEVGEVLGLSPHTVTCHLNNLFQKIAPNLKNWDVLNRKDVKSHPKILIAYRYAWQKEAPRVVFTERRNILTDRQTELAKRLASGLSVRRAAKEMGICVFTAQSHVQNSVRKVRKQLKGDEGLGKCSPIYLLVRYVFDLGLTQPLFDEV